MLPTEAALLCVSIHDVAPATWDDCMGLARVVREVADIPLTWLVVPRYHRSGGSLAAMEAQLGQALARGDELALHGYTHLDTETPGGGMGTRFLRQVYSRREGEFSALTAAAAQHRIELGLDWFAERGWPVSGFVAPAWLLSDGARQALQAFLFEYTTTYTRFHLLPQGPALFSPALVYAARNRTGRALSPLAADATAMLLARAPLVRLSLHPSDVHYPRLLRHAQRLVGRLLEGRAALTKVGCARVLTSMVPSTGLRASNPAPTRNRDGR